MNYYEDGYEDGYNGRPHKLYQSRDYDTGYLDGWFDHYAEHGVEDERRSD